MKDILENERTLSPQARFFKKHGLLTLSVFYQNLNESQPLRSARVIRYIFDHQPVAAYKGGILPFMGCDLKELLDEDDPSGYGIGFNYDGYPHHNEQKVQELFDLCQNETERYAMSHAIWFSRSAHSEISPPRYNHGGVHTVTDIPYVLKNGFLSYFTRIDREENKSTSFEKIQYLKSLTETAHAIEGYLLRYLASLEELYPVYEGNKDELARLIAAMKRVPFYPAESFYEALVSSYCVMFFARCFEPGRIDSYLYPYYKKDLENGVITKDEAFALIRLLFEEIDRRTGHPGANHVTIGGSDQNGDPLYNDLTEAAIVAIRGLHQPNLTLRVRKDMPQNIWDLALYNIGKGYSHPALVNEEQFLEHLTADYDIPYADAVDYVFGGCSEVLIQGKTMCDSTWVQYNMLDIFEQTFYNHFLSCKTFEEFLELFKRDLAMTIREMESHINARQFKAGMYENFPMRSLFTDGCIKHGKSYSNGGAQYNFDSTNIYGGTNTINSLYTLKAFYEGTFGDVTKEQLMDAMIANYEGYEQIHAKCKNITKFGNYDPVLNALAADLMEFTFDRVMELRCWRQNADYVGRYMPAIILWVDWVSSGKRVGATPDGRVLGEATADSCGPMQGTDSEGPTSTMGAALSLPQHKCVGTCVLNLRLDAANFETPEKTAKVQQLFRVYFAQGGNQLQVNVVDPQTLRDALKEPEKHKDIIVRVGGFSDNFVLLSKDIQNEILRRTEHQL